MGVVVTQSLAETEKRLIVSHSECDSIVLCELRHYYAFGEKLEPIEKSVSLERGITGHHFMHIFFKVLKETGNWDEALAVLNNELAQAVAKIKNAKKFEILAYLLRTINGFLDFYKERILTWDILEVEQTHYLDCGDFVFAFTTDVLIREQGRVKVVDWKFVYNFYNDTIVQLLPQIPRYIGALKALGQVVSGGCYGFLRYRDVQAEGEGNRFLLYNFTPSPERIENSFKDLMISVEKIAEKKRMPLEEWHSTARRASNMLPCQRCSFTGPCVEELNGGDAKLTRKINYQRSTYGYDDGSGE
jgi:hypothetical protein